MGQKCNDCIITDKRIEISENKDYFDDSGRKSCRMKRTSYGGLFVSFLKKGAFKVSIIGDRHIFKIETKTVLENVQSPKISNKTVG